MLKVVQESDYRMDRYSRFDDSVLSLANGSIGFTDRALFDFSIQILVLCIADVMDHR